MIETVWTAKVKGVLLREFILVVLEKIIRFEYLAAKGNQFQQQRK